MKKMMITMAVAGCAMAGVCEITSQNCVGESFFNQQKANENGGESDIGG